MKVSLSKMLLFGLITLIGILLLAYYAGVLSIRSITDYY